MSAIAGLYNFDQNKPVSIEQRNGMMKALEKFPANDIQVWQKGHVFLGCHAQWITPESIGEKLPFYDSERQCTITADCIVDNREDLFETLQIPRDDQKTIPDSLLILLAYYKWGEDCPKHLIGDFAFMIWNERDRKFFGATDPSGYRTLYYFKTERAFGFCTTIEPLLTLPFIKMKLNEAWIAEFLAIAGIMDTLDAKSTPYLGIEQIPPFHSITITQNHIKLLKYGEFYSDKRLKFKSDQDYVEAFREIYEEAVHCRLRSNKRIGSFLSGGLDSGSVVGFAAKKLKEENKKLHTFSYIPPSDFVDFTPNHLLPDERPYIKSTVNYVGGIEDHYLDFEGKNSYSFIDDLLDTMEIPYKFLENSFWLKGVFEEAHRNNVGVLLNGERGNFTISWGEPLYYYAYLLKTFRWFPLFKELNQFSHQVGGPRLRRIPQLAGLAFPKLNQMMRKKAVEKPDILINGAFQQKTKIDEKLRAFGFSDSGWFSSHSIYEHRRLLYTKIAAMNPGNTLDSKLSLRYALWKRDPTNDVRVVRYCLAIPENQYVHEGLGRALIRRSTKNVLPDEVRLNQVIRGVQAADWIHRLVPVWEDLINDFNHMIKDQRLGNYVNLDLIKNFVKETENGPQLSYLLSEYSLLMRVLILFKFLNKFN